jgi:TonB family protein
MKANDLVSSLPNSDFHLTLIDERPLAERLVSVTILGLRDLKQTLLEFREAPLECLRAAATKLLRNFFQKDRLIGVAIAITTLMLAGTSIFVIEKVVFPHPNEHLIESPVPEIQILSIANPREPDEKGMGKNGNGRVGLNKDRGEGSHTQPQKSGGGGSGGNRDPLPAQVGKLPMPSAVPAAIPKTPPLKTPSLPAAGIDLDPALWRDLKLPQYGDPLSKSDVASNGPGVDGGMGTRRGTGVGDGDGNGFGPGKNGNTGGDENQRGCCGPGASSGNVLDGWERRVFRVSEVEQRARLLAKPEPQYTEEARRNQTTGTVVLRVVFASSGEVTQIHAIQPLPFGLTERAIAAARRIKFIPASKSGHPVSVQMQLEYNFNLY